MKELSDTELESKLTQAFRCREEMRALSFAARAARMAKAGEILEKEKRELGKLMTQEMGKPITAAIAEAEKCALACRFYSENAERFLADETIKTDAQHSYVAYQPLGVVLAIMPWNFPFWQVVRFAAPALMAGNVGLLKHASNVPQCALALEDIFKRAGFPDGAFTALLIGSDRVEGLIADDRIAAVTLTGSEAAGMAVGSQAGKAIKKCVLELGGSDPFIIMPSADIENAIATAVKARIVNNGQSCIAAKRFIVHEAVADQVERGMVAGMEKLIVGDPMDERTQVGPLATSAILEELADQVRTSVSAGARILTGGKVLDRDGFYYAPTVLTDIPKDSPAYYDELFGPVASIFRVRSVEEAIGLANTTKFGLGSSAWTHDEKEQQQFIDGIEAGQVFINSMVASDPRLPFGGVKRSGYGRELGIWGIREFVNVKTIYVGKAQVP
ncbi:MAG TPA: NAD-dependent succinate-semialdehyde dehydrogenase [Longimicrobiales bacterium]|nr:NAD-dependent succinate-semialdehyde dehydrogenase [Longimicrobiales bacterium]